MSNAHTLLQQATRKPIMVTDCAKEIKAIGGTIWLLQKSDYGFILRCEIGPVQFRVVLPLLTDSSTQLMPEERTPTYIVRDLNGLRNWLKPLLD